jgi:hypothetical protein
MSAASRSIPFLLLATAPVAQAVHRVGPGHFATIQQAVDAASPGDVVLVDAGVYPTFRVDKSLTVAAQPSALVQVATTGVLAFPLAPGVRVHLAGLDVQAAAITIRDGMVSAERCTLRSERGVDVRGALLTTRWSAIGGLQGPGVRLTDAHLHASDSTFSTAAGARVVGDCAALVAAGNGTLQLSVCTLVGAWPGTPAAPAASAALDVRGLAAAGGGVRAWLVDCTLVGGLGSAGFGPALLAPSHPPTPLRVHRTTTFGAMLGAVAHGACVGLQTPVDTQLGATFTTRMRGEPGHPLLLYAGTNILGPFGIGEVEQPALGFFDNTILGTAIADANGHADFPFVVPAVPALRHAVLWWRGLDLVTLPWQATPAFVTVVQ